jgi:hypothetical protein
MIQGMHAGLDAGFTTLAEICDIDCSQQVLHRDVIGSGQGNGADDIVDLGLGNGDGSWFVGIRECKESSDFGLRRQCRSSHHEKHPKKLHFCKHKRILQPTSK